LAKCYVLERVCATKCYVLENHLFIQRINFNPLGEDCKQKYSMKSVEKGVKI